ncbi:hypothetical protein ES708_19243 [subsurface metagenome]
MAYVCNVGCIEVCIVSKSVDIHRHATARASHTRPQIVGIPFASVYYSIDCWSVSCPRRHRRHQAEATHQHQGKKYTKNLSFQSFILPYFIFIPPPPPRLLLIVTTPLLCYNNKDGLIHHRSIFPPEETCCRRSFLFRLFFLSFLPCRLLLYCPLNPLT